MTRSNPLFRLFAVLFAAALVFGACGGGDGEDPADSEAQLTESPEDFAGGDGGNGGAGECGGSGGQAVEVEAEQFAFNPDEISAPAGETVTVTFTNSDDTPHTFTVTDLACDTSAVGGGAEAELSFTMPEEETEFICTIHPDMKGTLTPE